ncbi:MAG: FecR family protein [Niabella sp.]
MLERELFIQLFNKYAAGTCTPTERETFFQIIRSNPDHPLVSELMDDLYETVKEEAALEAEDWASMPEKPKGKVRSMFYKIAIAAMLIGVISYLSIRFLNKRVDYKEKITGNILQTPKAHSNYVLLSDSTQVWVNAATELRYPKQFAKDKREIYLEGEAFLDVKHADKVPFIVHLPGGTAVTVLGTAFNIKAFPDRQQLIVTVKRGKVSVSKNDKVLKVLTVGQELKVGMKNNSTAVNNVDIEKITSWQSGILYFNDMMLKDVVKDINQQKDINIQIDNEKLANTIISTRFDKQETTTGILNVLKTITDCKVKEQNGTYILY